MKKYKSLLSLGLLLLLLGIFYYYLGCPIKLVTGISCPGCGMTRATLSALCFKFSQAFYYHPLVFIPPLFLVFYLLKEKFFKRIYKPVLYILIFLFIIVYFYRLFDPANYIVTIDIKNGLIYKVIKFIGDKLK